MESTESIQEANFRRRCFPALLINYMNKNYTVNGNNTRTLPRPVYHQCLWILKDYNRLKDLVAGAESDSADGSVVFYAGDMAGLTPKSVLDEAKLRTDAMEHSLNAIPEEYREGIFNYFVNDARLPDEASDNTWKKWKRLYLETLARELNLY